MKWLAALLLLASCQYSASSPCTCPADQRSTTPWLCPYYRCATEVFHSCSPSSSSPGNSYDRCPYSNPSSPMYARGSECLLCDSLPEKCKSATNDCSWYSECLHERYPNCIGSGDYALSYGKVYCEKYGQNIHMFSEEGQKWVEEVRRCLQTLMIPNLATYYDYSCSEIKSEAFTTHKRCYVSPGTTSICQLNCPDLLAVLWTTKGAFVDETWETIKSSLGVTGSCLKEGSSTGFKVCLGIGAVAAGAGIFTLTKIAVLDNSFSNYFRGKRYVACDDRCIADNLALLIFQKLNLPASHNITWFAFPERSATDLKVSVLLSNLNFLSTDEQDLSKSSAGDALETATRQFTSLSTNQANFTVDGRVLQLGKVSTCKTLECEEEVSSGISITINMILVFLSSVIYCL